MYHKNRWTAQKIEQRIGLIKPLVYRRKEQLPLFRFQESEHVEVATPETVGVAFDDSNWGQIEHYSQWGHWETMFVMRSRFCVPENWNSEQTAFFLPLGEAGDFSHPEALLYIDGESVAACDRHHQLVAIPSKYCDGKQHILALHGWTGRGSWDGGMANRLSTLVMKPCELVEIDQPTRQFIATAQTALEAVKCLDDNNPTLSMLLNALDAAFITLDTTEPLKEGFYDTVEEATKVLHDGIKKSGPALNVDIVATGHAHIDVAWLWTLEQTRLKSGRTFSTVDHLMTQYPEYHFTQSQPQLYDYVRQDYPELFEKIKKRIKSGNWEPIGGMWVEADCNISGHESLARQFLLGRRFFRDHFGADAEAPVLWLPDVFGYAWNLPQLIKKSGMDYFFTTKIGWNQYNRLPYDSFWWQGLDGTKVLTHFGTTSPLDGGWIVSTYNATTEPNQAMGTWANFQQKGEQQELMMPYGYGDGGGGPTLEMLDNIREMGDFPAMPRMRQGSMKDYFEKLDEESGDRLPTWNGELYLEYHRGTYTTQAATKKGNRKSEFALHDAELLASWAMILDEHYSYPQDELTQAWQLVCLNQFHDILPGSSIGEVYVQTAKDYAQVRAITEEVKAGALNSIGQHIEGDVVVVNPCSFKRHDLAVLDEALGADEQLIDVDGEIIMTQPTEKGTLVAVGNIEGFTAQGYSIVSGKKADRTISPLKVSKELLENDHIRIGFNADGDIVTIYDKVNERELLAEGQIGNQFQAFEDRPMAHDAWDIDIYYEDRMWTAEPAESITIVEEGPLRATLEIKRKLSQSTIIQRISLCSNSNQIDFDTWIDWREDHTLLKAAFPLEILSPVATFEIQWGHVERPTHYNTSWDWARFETCAQKWVDMSEQDYGVSLLNDCKYGYNIHDNVMRITLLRSPKIPDPQADRGEHRFTYSLLPHTDGPGTETIQASYALNDPLIVRRQAKATVQKTAAGFITLDRDDVLIETVKKAEDDGSIIVRLYQTLRQRCEVTLVTAFDVKSACIVSILEDEQEEVAVEGHQVKLGLHPFEIVTLKLIPRNR